jgi:multicomponent Na+:H+ antiporter subunit D
VGKWYIAVGAVEAQAWPLAIVILASTLLTLAYFARLVERMYFRDPTRSASTTGDDPETHAGPDTGTETGVVADGVSRSDVSRGMCATVVAAALLAVALGVGAFEYSQLIRPTVERLLS